MSDSEVAEGHEGIINVPGLPAEAHTPRDADAGVVAGVDQFDGAFEAMAACAAARRALDTRAWWK